MKTVQISNSTEVTIVSDEDFPVASRIKWNIDPTNGYIRNKNCGYLHRLLMGYPKGSNIQVDHKNRNKLDNTRENLRLVTSQQNSSNRGMHPLNKSGYKGVYFRKIGRNKPWFASVAKNGKQVSCGYFSTKEEAARAYDRKALELFGAYIGTLNFPEEHQ